MKRLEAEDWGRQPVRWIQAIVSSTDQDIKSYSTNQYKKLSIILPYSHKVHRLDQKILTGAWNTYDVEFHS